MSHKCALCGRLVHGVTEPGPVLHTKCRTVLDLLPASAHGEILKLAASLPTTTRPRIVLTLLDRERRARAGCIDLHFSQHGTGPLVGVYRNKESGIEIDPETPWSVVCQKHNTLVCVESRAAAMSTSADTRNFCDDCRDA